MCFLLIREATKNFEMSIRMKAASHLPNMIEIPPPSFRLTPYGEVDATGLDRFQQHFDTSQQLHLVDRLDRCLADIGGTAALRDELLRLHAMSMTPVLTPTSRVSPKLDCRQQQNGGQQRQQDSGTDPAKQQAP
ncbi:hypothetical protein PSOLE_32800 [Pseudomonas oleovorans subsp. oleovorans]|uniref:Tn4652, tnpA repressor protein TnpC n=1 Tax=Ectopseudomonas oleovorans TaxID=301 RepID=A0A379PIG5_ECTOL|nr:hypothetical protein PSOLE_32800 [Pseudomonas oleovorans subsp. oleovorans]SEJ96496.1 hypothetical protein SAMN05216280_107316 [Pseudomonas oleovorans]SUE72407.1 Tn4652, tnpA repressor protein TnpC [Pseudomonas oleovorans]